MLWLPGVDVPARAGPQTDELLAVLYPGMGDDGRMVPGRTSDSYPVGAGRNVDLLE